MATQAERRAETRGLLLDAAAELFAERGIDSTSIDAIADRAGRTSGAVYDHFGGKEGVLLALLDGWVDDVAAVVGAELITASSLRESLMVLWRNVTTPVAGGGQWIALEHELWTYAIRNEDAAGHLTARYRVAGEGISTALTRWTGGADTVGQVLIGMLLGLEMMRRVAPDSITDEAAVDALVRVVAETSS
ncbi:MAG: TetR/AcrR family transcriptional regulator [Microthrixaceae bacterium]